MCAQWDELKLSKELFTVHGRGNIKQKVRKINIPWSFALLRLAIMDSLDRMYNTMA